MLTLAFDTSFQTVAVAILQDNAVLYDTIINVDINHSEVLLPAIDQACLQTRIKITDFDLFVCTIGPGSFTGLRIGASTLKGFMFATGRPAVGVSSLAALALNISDNSKIICSVMDAGRGQVYVAYFRYNQKNLLEQIGADEVVNPTDIDPDFKQEALFVGDGAIKYADIISGTKKKNIFVASQQQQYIRASSVAILGIEKFKRNEILDAETFVPVYLRSADAHPKKAFLKK
ncbi:MAG: tRNA (adenosine(37)-N6)-threonylcarbamoyltransferase complex dimerization subunit type 1 TsaB [Deltaproteobacteria bacterium HGW-Deltaproteobacteria-2]|jgi:tRNA threonylcarbamoyl adenosine modification protein YeaZ|nr:MAG: tRNA (adenosine(37)-N6)-threonylcarbamoyltransferase complex dimerization subunit type 1 TsaB [Deltaproteobacteria bacterium HGW-Deltaproteobacteria-2]